MNRRFALALALSIGSCVLPSGAVQARGRSGATTVNATAVKWVQVTPETMNALASLGSRPDVGAISLEVTGAELVQNSAAQQALMAWVGSGGVVFLHTDAAQLFGYRTQPARTTTPRVAGQLYGRARAALPFGAHPLLWGALNPPTTDSDSLGVDTVYYQMEAGDHLVVEHPAGVPLLRVTDLAADSAAPLFAAAMAPYGNGWAVFTPTLVEQHRGDGAAFVQNLVRLADSAARTRNQSTAGAAREALASVSATVIERAADQLRSGNAEGLAALVPEFTASLRPVPSGALGGFAGSAPAAETPAPARNREETPRLLLTGQEIRGIAALLDAAAGNAGARATTAALINLLRARLSLQSDDLTTAVSWLEQAERATDRTAETALWRGIIAAAQAEDVTLGSRVRADLLANAAQSWSVALGASTLLRAAQGAGIEETGAASGGAAISGVPRELIRAWGRAATLAANVLSVEPPLVTRLGGGESGVIMRHFANDPSLRLALPSGALISNAATVVGWRADEEELLIFPTPEYYRAYRRAAGLGQQQVPSPAGEYGDIVGSRMMIMSQFTLPVVLPPARPGQAPRVLQFGTAVPAVIARMHSYILVNALAEGGTPVPEWMSGGLASLINLKVISEISNAGQQVEMLRQTAQAGGLLTPAQFRGAATRPQTAGIAEAQAANLMSYFYGRFGPGGVMETFQRLGSGESVDEALLATTGLNEEQFFQAWYNGQFGRAYGGRF